VITLKARVGWDDEAKALVVEAPSDGDAAVAFIVIGQALERTSAFNSRASALWEQLRTELVNVAMPPMVVVRPGENEAKS
jgi:hypothetical protein